MGWIVAIAAMCLVAFIVREVRIYLHDKKVLEQQRKEKNGNGTSA